MTTTLPCMATQHSLLLTSCSLSTDTGDTHTHTHTHTHSVLYSRNGFTLSTSGLTYNVIAIFFLPLFLSLSLLPSSLWLPRPTQGCFVWWSTPTNGCPSTQRRSLRCTRGRNVTRCHLTSMPSLTRPTETCSLVSTLSFSLFLSLLPSSLSLPFPLPLPLLPCAVFVSSCKCWLQCRIQSCEKNGLMMMDVVL